MGKIWARGSLDLDDLNELCKNTLAQTLDMQFIEVGDDYLSMRMPVNSNTHQPYGLLHGGASAALAETVGSVASALCTDPERYNCVGIEINCNHIKSVRNGYVTATARPLHIGRTLHVWDIQIENEQKKRICASRLTVAIIPKKAQAHAPSAH